MSLNSPSKPRRAAKRGRNLPMLALLFLPCLTGCGGSEGPERVAVSGEVRLDGRPLASGVIRFIPSGDNEGPAAVAIVKDGAYELPKSEGPVPGPQRVEIEATDYLGFAIDDEAAYAANVEQRGGRVPKNPVPEAYNRRSTLTAEIKPDGSQKFDFTLSSQATQSAQR
jgi:hypothetical protein